MSFQELTKVIKSRRSIYPNMYIDKEISDDLIVEILENANWAPTHKKTEPWRFKIFKGEAKARLSEYLGDYYLQHTSSEKITDLGLNKAKEKPIQSACVIAICMQRDPLESLPEWEELSAVAAAVQNMWLSCTSLGIGSYWSSPSSILKADEFLNLAEGEKCYGLFYMGYINDIAKEIKSQRKPIVDKITWM